MAEQQIKQCVWTRVELSAKELAKKYSDGSIIFDGDTQRKLCWTVEMKSRLIASMLQNVSIGNITVSVRANGEKNCIDGKQRSQAIKAFLNNEFALHKKTPEIPQEDGTRKNISGMYFKDLPEEERNWLENYEITLTCYQGLPLSEEMSLFGDLNEHDD